MQFAPPFLGAGSEHSLRLNWTPGPQVALQGLQELQSDQPPATEVSESFKKYLLLILIINFCGLEREISPPCSSGVSVCLLTIVDVVMMMIVSRQTRERQPPTSIFFLFGHSLTITWSGIMNNFLINSVPAEIFSYLLLLISGSSMESDSIGCSTSAWFS